MVLAWAEVALLYLAQQWVVGEAPLAVAAPLAAAAPSAVVGPLVGHLVEVAVVGALEVGVVAVRPSSGGRHVAAAVTLCSVMLACQCTIRPVFAAVAPRL